MTDLCDGLAKQVYLPNYMPKIYEAGESEDYFHKFIAASIIKRDRTRSTDN